MLTSAQRRQAPLRQGGTLSNGRRVVCGILERLVRRVHQVRCTIRAHAESRRSSSPAPRKRHVLDSDADTSDDDRPIKPKPKADLRDFFGSTYSARPAAPVAKKRKTAAVPGGGLSQMVLDISDRPTTATCAECSMSYSRIAPEDVALHRTFHDNVVGGIDWPSKLGKGVTVLEDGLGPKRADRIMAVEASSTGALGRKVRAEWSVRG